MIAKQDRDRAFAESVGYRMGHTGPAEGTFEFCSQDFVTTSVQVEAGIVVAAHNINSQEDPAEHPYLGLPLADAVLQHMEDYTRPVCYARLTT